MREQPTLLITGRNGQLGSELNDLAAHFTQFRFVNLSREELPVTDEGALRKAFAQYCPQYFINCAAYTAVDKAEEDKAAAEAANATAPGIIATLCKEFGCKLIHISTDYVFNGRGTAAYREEDATDPVNYYGATKLQGEERIMQANPDSVIIRTSWVYSAYGKNFVKTMLRLMKEKQSIQVVADQFGSPTYAADLALALLQIIASGKWVPGIYHYSNEGVISWFEFAQTIQEHSGAVCAVMPIATSQYPTPAARPLWSVMSKEKIARVYGLPIFPWKDSLYRCMEKI